MLFKMENTHILYNEDELTSYFNNIKNKFDKIIKYELIIIISVFFFMVTGFGLVPASFLNMIFFNYPPHQPYFLILTWMIFFSIIYYPLLYASKRKRRMPYSNIDRRFYYAFSVYQNIDSHLKSENFDLLKKASKFLKKTMFDELKTIVKKAYDIPGIDKSELLTIETLFDINKEIVLPRLIEGIKINEIKPIVGNFAQFLYSEKQGDMIFQEELASDSVERANELKPYKKVRISAFKNFKDKTYLSENPIISTLSFSLSIIFILSIVGYLLKFYDILKSENIALYVIGILPVSVLGGIELAKMFSHKLQLKQ